MTTTINSVTTEVLNSAITSASQAAKPATAGSNAAGNEELKANDDSFLSSLLKLNGDTTETTESVTPLTEGNILPEAVKSAENTLVDGNQLPSPELIQGLNTPLSILQTNQHAPITPLSSTAEQPLALNIGLKDSVIKTAAEGNLLSTSIRQLLPSDAKVTGQHVLVNSTGIKATAGGTVTAQLDAPLLNADGVIIASQKMPAPVPIILGQLPAMTAQQALAAQSLAVVDAQMALLQQTSSASAENASSLLSPTVSPSAASATTTGLSSLTSLPPLSIAERFGQPAWAQGMSKQIVWMAGQNINRAEIRLNPAHLGPIEVRIDIRDELINVALSSRHAVVREAMETALPRLREMLDDNGMNLADADISQQSFAEQREQNTENRAGVNMTNSFGSNDFIHSDETILHQTKVTTTLVDYYI